MQKKRKAVGVARASSGHFFNKKGQITIYVIMGLLLLLGVAIIIAVQKEIVTFPKEEILPTGKGKFERMISSCIQDIGEEAIYRIGLQAGYLDVPEDILIDPTKSVKTSPFNAIPFWAYGETTFIVPLTEIKQRIDTHIENNLQPCLLQLQPFQESYDVIELSEIESNTELVEAKTLFNVRWDLAIKTKTGETISEIINHVAESPIKLKKTHELAVKIILKELLDLKLEDITQDLIALEHPDVPVAGFEFTCTPKSWDYQKLQSSLKNLLRINIAQIQIEGNQFLKYPKELPYYSSHYVWDIGATPDPGLSVAFSYQDNFPTTLQVHPRTGNTLRSTSVETGDILSIFCMQNWKFVYDLTYPIIIDVRDESTGFSFKTATSVHIRGNIPDRSGTNTPPRSQLPLSFADEKFCAVKKVIMSVYSYELIENPRTGVFDKQPLDAVDLTFDCLKFSCPVGQTEYDFAGMGDISAARTLFPYCIGGILQGQKLGYKRAWQRVVTTANKEIEIDLVPIHNYPSSQISFVKHTFSNQQLGPAIPITDETVLLTLTYDKPNQQILPGEPFHRAKLAYTATSDLNDQQQLQFLAKTDFEYVLDIKLLRGSEIIGGYNGNWTVDWQDLQSSPQLTFHLIQSSSSGNNLLDFLITLPETSKLLPQPELK